MMILISCFTSILFLASKTSASEDPIFTVREEQHHDDDSANINDSFDFHTNPTTDDASEKQTECSNYLRSLLLISTLDGQISCLDAVSGKQLWNIDSQNSLLSSSISHLKSPTEFTDVRFIPSLDGGLYKWNGKNLEVVPLSTDYLLGQVSQLPDGSLIVGGKEIKISGIDVDTGKLYYECSTTGCQRIDSGENIKEKDVLLLRRTQQTVRAISKRTAYEKWNFSVGNYALEYLEGDINEISSAAFCQQTPITPVGFHFSVQDGIVSGIDSAWTFKFDNPIAAAWKFEQNKLKPIDILQYGVLEGISDDNFDHSSLMYLGIHEGQMYIQQPLQVRTVDAFAHELHIMEQPKLHHWRPFISTSHARTPFLSNDKQSALTTLDHPFDNGFVLLSNNFTSTEIVIRKKSENPFNDEGTCNKDNGDTCSTQKPAPTFKEGPDFGNELVPLSLRDWWKEIVVLSILIAVAINVAVRVFKSKFMKKEPQSQLPKEVEESIEVGQEESAAPVFIKTDRILAKTNSVSVYPDSLEQSEARTSSSSSEFSSRYLTDFDHLQCLGKGGFGVVFKAKKKIDYCEYAIKRIFLPRCEEAKEKMMREVRALAALDHPGIVRYFHAWWEAPPDGWQYTTDKEFLLGGTPDTPSYALSQDWVIEINSLYEREEREKNNTLTDVESSAPQQKPRRISDDPMGKRFNFDTGVEDIVVDHREFDLLKHNDVFFGDNSQEEISEEIQNNEYNVEDSFEICFESSTHNSNVNDNNSCSDCKINLDSVSARGCINAHSKNDPQVTGIKNRSVHTEDKTTDDKKKPSKLKKRYVGKCCSRNSNCLTEPPLFLYIQMQLCQQATLKDWLNDKTSGISIAESMSIFLQIVNAVDYFHSRGMMHRDLKPANIFFSMDGSVKVGDFGLVTAITRPSKGKHKGRLIEAENHTGQVGTQLYMSPEQASGRPYNHKVDIYALGLIFFELVCFFSTQMERMQTIYRLKQGILPEKLNDSSKGRLVKLLTSEDANLRPEAKDIKTNDFVKEIEACTSE